MNLRTYDSFGKNAPLLLTETVLLERIVFIRNFDSKIYLNCYFSDSVKSSLLKIKSVKIVKMWPPRSESNLRLKILWTIIGQRSCVHAVETPIGDDWPIKIGSCVTWQWLDQWESSFSFSHPSTSASQLRSLDSNEYSLRIFSSHSSMYRKYSKYLSLIGTSSQFNYEFVY